jgi:hypothetical protein
MPPNGIAAGIIHVGQPVTKYLPGYYRTAHDGDPIAGRAQHCADLGEPITVTTEFEQE